MEDKRFERLRVLVIDDNRHTLDLLTNILQGFGIRHVYPLDAAVEAFSQLRASPVDFAVVDWEMEPMNGVDFVRLLRTEKDSPNIFLPTIMVTGNNEIAHVTGARDAGANEYLIKPVSPKILYDRINSIIWNPRPFVRTETYFGPDRRRRDGKIKGRERRETEPDFIYPPNMRPGAVPGPAVEERTLDPEEEEMMRRAEAAVEALKTQYPDYARQHIANLEAACRLAEADPGGRDDHLKKVASIAHDVKGEGTTYGYPLMTELGGSLCKFVKHVKGSGPGIGGDQLGLIAQLDLIAKHVEAMTVVIRERMEGDGGPIGQEMVATIGKAVSRLSR